MIHFNPQDISLVDSTISMPGHGLSNGTIVTFSTDGEFPDAINSSQHFTVMPVSADAICICASNSDDSAGDAVTFTTQGSGIHTLTAV